MSSSGVAHVSLPVSPTAYSGATTLGVLGGRIVVGDNPGGKSCRLAFVQPTSLQVLSDRPTSCDDPRLAGYDVAPVESLPRVASQTGEVQIATWDSRAQAAHLGPVVMQYGNYSDSRPEWAYGGGNLWIFDVDTPSGAEVLRVSLSTGQVLASVKVPAISRVVMSAGPDGLWLGQSQESGWPAGKPRPQLLYFIGAHATSAKVVPQRGTHLDYLNWLVADGQSAWANVQTGEDAQLLEAFSGPRPPVATLHLAGTSSQVPTDFGEGVFDSPPIIYAPNFGLVYNWPGAQQSVYPGTSQEDVMRLDPATGRTSKVATMATQFGMVQADLVYNGAFYILMGGDGATSSSLYRVPL